MDTPKDVEVLFSVDLDRACQLGEEYLEGLRARTRSSMNVANASMKEKLTEKTVVSCFKHLDKSVQKILIAHASLARAAVDVQCCAQLLTDSRAYRAAFAFTLFARLHNAAKGDLASAKKQLKVVRQTMTDLGGTSLTPSEGTKLPRIGYVLVMGNLCETLLSTEKVYELYSTMKAGNIELTRHPGSGTSSVVIPVDAVKEVIVEDYRLPATSEVLSDAGIKVSEEGGSYVVHDVTPEKIKLIAAIKSGEPVPVDEERAKKLKNSYSSVRFEKEKKAAPTPKQKSPFSSKTSLAIVQQLREILEPLSEAADAMPLLDELETSLVAG